MTQPISIMLDLETWGTEPGCDIRSIGACVFNPVSGAVHGWNVERDDNGTGVDTFYIATANPIVNECKTCANGAYTGLPGNACSDCMNTGYDYGEPVRAYELHRDPRTVQWWSEQSADAQAAFADPVDLRDALGRFGAWLSSVIDGMQSEPQSSTALRLWSHGPAFDPPILAAAYRAVGLPVPWHYRAPRDTRTAFDMAGIDDHTAWLEQHPGPLGVSHHALDDAICQARAVCGAYERLRVPHDVMTHRDAWRNAIGSARDLSMGDSESDDTDYYNHEIKAFDRTFDALVAHPQVER